MDDDKAFYHALICYNILIEGSHHVSYLLEKHDALCMGYDYLALLDYNNQKKVKSYLMHWNMETPKEWREAFDRLG